MEHLLPDWHIGLYINYNLSEPNLDKVVFNDIMHDDVQHTVTFDRNVVEQSFLHQNVQKIVFIAMNCLS